MIVAARERAARLITELPTAQEEEAAKRQAEQEERQVELEAEALEREAKAVREKHESEAKADREKHKTAKRKRRPGGGSSIYRRRGRPGGRRDQRYRLVDAIKECEIRGQWERALELLTEMRELERDVRKNERERDDREHDLPRFDWADGCTINVQRVPSSATKNDLRQALSDEFGEVVHSWLSMKGLCHDGNGNVTFAAPDAAARALAAGTVELHGAAVRILGPTTIWDDNKGRPRLFQCLRLTISACGKGGQWKHALELLTEMQTRGLKPDVITFNAAISACERGGQWEHALELLTEMQTQGVTPDVITFGSAISACEQGGQWERALSLLTEMQTQGVEPDVRSFSAAISACEKGGQSERARELEAMKTVADVVDGDEPVTAALAAEEQLNASERRAQRRAGRRAAPSPPLPPAVAGESSARHVSNLPAWMAVAGRRDAAASAWLRARGHAPDALEGAPAAAPAAAPPPEAPPS